MEGPCFKIVISKSYMDVAIMRTPFDGIVKSYRLQHGSQLSDSTKLAPLLNEQASIVFETENKQIAVEHLSLKSIDRLYCYPVAGQSIKQGMRYGLMLSGEITIYLPEKSRVAVKVDEEVVAGQTLLGYFS
jgi:phosphatidylserine decarboxylase